MRLPGSPATTKAPWAFRSPARGFRLPPIRPATARAPAGRSTTRAPVACPASSPPRVFASTLPAATTRGACSNSPPDSAAGSVSCTLQDNGQTFTLTGTWFAVKGIDLAPPTATGTVTVPQGDILFVPTDTFQVTVAASDDRRVLWAGYRLGPPANVQDSAKVLKSSFT